MFVVVEFNSSGLKVEYAAVSAKWVENNKCFWPDQEFVLQNIADNLVPDRNWKRYDCKVVSFHCKYLISFLVFSPCIFPETASSQ